MSQSKSIIARFETTTPAPEPTVEPPEIEIPLTETPLGGGELPDTGHALPGDESSDGDWFVWHWFSVKKE